MYHSGCPYSRIRSHCQSPRNSQWTAALRSPFTNKLWPSDHSALKEMSLPANTSPAITDTLGYLQHHLQELTKHQNALEHIINATLTGLTAQLQQLTQLITTPAPTVTLPLIPTSLPPVSPLPWFRPPHLNSRRGQNSLLLQTSLVNRALVKSSLTPVHYIYAWPQSSSAVTRRKSYGLSPFSKMDELRGGSRTSFAIRGQP